ncbi:protein-tyrosine-phosphatase [Croceivirga sp. JEA036]|uniref:protein-tyrosine-phosphatase n=1 Tax=Croceivirga sp. JEA036 TaxID=2721162 RepID=UPI0014388A40|nr:protein-tyrosine-phosphatase [Croceivirga sp. JEA036]NJB36421.1 protein-tyrosine-phosphatase [Croceivirga sp. JEA036]
MNTNNLYPNLKETLAQINTASITEERKTILTPLAQYLKSKINEDQPILLNFICTHNSRRSHLSQIWAQTIGHYFNVKQLYCYSGGTEATALFPKVAETLTNQGFQIQVLSKEDNPVYAVKFQENEPAVIGFSKRYDHDFNPANGFGAIMTCSSADQGCPFVAGAEKRFPITFEDPKVSDGTPEQDATYLARSVQIAMELKFVFEEALK